jgi:hypothetical protein
VRIEIKGNLFKGACTYGCSFSHVLRTDIGSASCGVQVNKGAIYIKTAEKQFQIPLHPYGETLSIRVALHHV